ncbi:protein NLP2-like [Chenopodium quinoa]|uniref:protein NLP2-like n=1 Tax=Chenopodium quinoa TaxID=63459 RepID=UPI000B78EBCF|nr:protein NLP2-like [Chenopodium quinoa]
MSSGQNQKSSIDHSLSFEDVSKLFSLPLSEAADILGVSSGVLKKICNENGLERWPHRKYLAGKSIEDIKKEAAKEKNKALRGVSPKSNVTTPSTITSTPGSLAKDNKSPKPTPEISKSQGNNNAQQNQGSKTVATWRSHHMLASGLAIETSTSPDEFKYGFPSAGLSECSNRWWGSSNDSNDGVLKDDDTKTSSEVKDASKVQVDGVSKDDDTKTSSEVKDASKVQVDGVSKDDDTKTSSEVKDASKVQVDDSASMCEERTDSMEEDSKSDKKDEISLSATRKRALEEGKKALNFSVLKKYGADKLRNEEKILLRRLYQTS